jgi:3-oxoacid CoA-transferase subunit A
MTKIVKNASEALGGLLKDGLVFMAGGFGLCGIPENSIAEIRKSEIKDLTFISNNCGVDGFGLGILLNNKQIKKMISSYVGENKEFERQFLNAELELEFNPQGTLAERIRAGGAGIPAFFTKTGYGTVVAEGKETRHIDGKDYVLEYPIKADFALIKAHKGDRWGNLVFNKSARNFGPIMAMAADVTIAQVSEVVELGQLDPEHIITPGIFVQHVVAVKATSPVAQ